MGFFGNLVKGAMGAATRSAASTAAGNAVNKTMHTETHNDANSQIVHWTQQQWEGMVGRQVKCYNTYAATWYTLKIERIFKPPVLYSNSEPFYIIVTDCAKPTGREIALTPRVNGQAAFWAKPLSDNESVPIDYSQYEENVFRREQSVSDELEYKQALNSYDELVKNGKKIQWTKEQWDSLQGQTIFVYYPGQGDKDVSVINTVLIDNRLFVMCAASESKKYFDANIRIFETGLHDNNNAAYVVDIDVEQYFSDSLQGRGECLPLTSFSWITNKKERVSLQERIYKESKNAIKQAKKM